MYICEKCEKEHDGSFGSGRFCSRSCANTRQHSKETRQKISNTLSNRVKNNNIDRSIRYCKNCGKQLSIKNVSGYCITCCRRRPVSDIQKKKQSETMKSRGYPRWNIKRNEPSYAEKFFMTVLLNNDIPYRFDVNVKNHKHHFYIIDFYVEKENIKIDLEIDGKQHEWEQRKKHDQERDEFLTKLGFIVYRIKWNEINSENGKLLMKKKIDEFLKFYKSL